MGRGGKDGAMSFMLSMFFMLSPPICWLRLRLLIHLTSYLSVLYPAKEEEALHEPRENGLAASEGHKISCT